MAGAVALRPLVAARRALPFENPRERVKVYTFIADSAPEAVAQIRAQLGPEAVVLNVRQVAAAGLQKMWKKPRIEVLAHLPEEVEPQQSAVDPLRALSELRQEIADLRQCLPRAEMVPAVVAAPVAARPELPSPSRFGYGGWKVGNFLEQAGILPKFVQGIVEELQNEFGEKAPETLVKEFEVARAVILRRWGNLLPSIPTGTHIFIGTPGCGKTTVLCKRLAQLVLMEGISARVLRLDGARANTAESLSVYCEILGVPVERCLSTDSGELTFVDLPGAGAADLEGLKKQIAEFPGAQVHLVLNAAYETATLLNQVRAFSALPISSLVFTHLDEEQRWGKLLNFVFGTKFSIGFLSAGQNVPGDLLPATAEKIVSRVIPSK